ncbi:SDR family oxidoreductase [Curtobacterium sp. MCBD17_035]|uniref:SDR family oxidoreductase n=1 Tax=Curtobacterium sp. MCBD17_035 TaxID=2175673 RepID=UPI000DAA981D|nr:SDR family oxidoreductase [Curtobacterium sp. MCBD17_035]WIB66020.1 SDR family oxidoreductase [Curtobacterium sp. MCBD17_035]
MRLLVTGATGYIGGRLVPRLLEAGHDVRVLARTPRKLDDVPWRDRVEVVQGDLTDADAVARAVDGMEAVYYLAHSMGTRGDFEETERRAARTMASAARAAGVRRFVYLGGLHPDGATSKHLRSRAEVGQVLLDSGVPTVALQAGVVIGSGSTSFEMIRHLTDVLPWMPAPRWVRNRIQPIAVRDVLYHLVRAIELPADVNRTFDIGGPDVLRYGQMLNAYAVEAGLPQRPISTLPVLTPELAAHWFNLVTPIPRALAKPIIESLQYECVQREHDIDAFIPHPDGGLTPYRTAVRLALQKTREGEVEMSWRNASMDGAPSDPLPSDPEWAGHVVDVDDRTRRTTASAEDVWRVIESIGGDNGWYSLPLAWALRGWMDRIAGGVGLSRGRRNPDRLETGDVLDWWRVEELDRGRYLRLRAEFKAPGRAWLELSVRPTEDGSEYHQRAIWFPQGLAGRLYWWSILPFHGIIFPGMVERITARAERGGGRQDLPHEAPLGTPHRETAASERSAAG